MSDEQSDGGFTMGLPKNSRRAYTPPPKSPSPGSPPRPLDRTTPPRNADEDTNTDMGDQLTGSIEEAKMDPSYFANLGHLRNIDIPTDRGGSNSYNRPQNENAEPVAVNPWNDDDEPLAPPTPPQSARISKPQKQLRPAQPPQPVQPAQPARPASKRKSFDPNITNAPGTLDRYPEDELDFASIRMEVLPPGKNAIWRRVGTYSRHENGPWIIGRSIAGNKASLLNSIAEEHFQLLIEPNGQFVIEPLQSLNGVYERLTPRTKYELIDQSRLIIGEFLIEFRTADPSIEPVALRSAEGEEFRGTFLYAPALLHVLGPDNKPCVTFPLMDRLSTVVGRGGPNPNLELNCDISLPDDHMLISRAHCEFIQEDGKFYLVDLGSRNGTFLQLDGRTDISVGSASNPEQAAQFSVGQLLFRFIDE